MFWNVSLYFWDDDKILYALLNFIYYLNINRLYNNNFLQNKELTLFYNYSYYKQNNNCNSNNLF